MMKIKKTKKLKLYIMLISIFLILSGALWFFENRVNPVIIMSSEARIKSLTTTAVNSAINNVIGDINVYDSLIKVINGEDGSVQMLQANAVAINFFGSLISRQTQTKLDAMGEQVITIPLGNFSGMPILLGRGPDVNFKLSPIGSVFCNFTSYFTSAGINQTNHKIYIKVTTNISLILPVGSKSVNVAVEILVAESIVVGKVPDVYLQSQDLNNMLNLIP